MQLPYSLHKLSRHGSINLPKLTFHPPCGSMRVVVLDGELAVPYTRNPPQRGRTPP